MKLFFKILLINMWLFTYRAFLVVLVVCLYLLVAYLIGSFFTQYFETNGTAYILAFVFEIGVSILIGDSWEQYNVEKNKKCFCGGCKIDR